jgi:hypothetical protein
MQRNILNIKDFINAINKRELDREERIQHNNVYLGGKMITTDEKGYRTYWTNLASMVDTKHLLCIECGAVIPLINPNQWVSPVMRCDKCKHKYKCDETGHYHICGENHWGTNEDNDGYDTE